MRLVKNVVLVGMPACGKTVVGKKLASSLNALSVDTDELIEFETGMSAGEIFDKHGESVFRKYETKALTDAVKMENAVISTGGGAVEIKENLDLIKDCFIIYLYASKKALLDRSKNSDRPLLRGDAQKKLDEIYHRRKKLYESCRDAQIFTSSISANTAANKILEILIDLNIALP